MSITSFRMMMLLFIANAGLNIVSAQEKKYIPPTLSHPESWTMIMLPDPQTYVKFGRNQPVFELMTAWIADNSEKLNIKMVVCTGDLVEQNEMINPDRINGDQTSKAQWESVSRSFGRLDGIVPYIPASGNHDFGYKSIEHRRSAFDKYFPIDKNPLTMKMVKEVGFNIDGSPTLANAAFEFTPVKEKKYLIVNLEFAPRDTTIAWAKKVIAMEKFKDHRVIVLTHSYMNAKNEHILRENYSIKDANYGASIWTRLIQPSSNIEMVLAGHIGGPDDPKAHVAFRTDKNAGGKRVQQLVFNAQALGGGWNGNGGDGWLRILEFLPDGKSVNVKTFSPFFAFSPTTQQFAWRTEVYDNFSFSLD